MAIFNHHKARERDLGAQFSQVYKSLPVPTNNEQYVQLLGWMKEDRRELFAYARFSLFIKLVLAIVIFWSIAIVVLYLKVPSTDVFSILRSIPVP